MKKYYKDSYGCTASIATKNGKHILTIAYLGVKDGKIKTIKEKKEYLTFRGARIAMGRRSDTWKENNNA